MKRFALLALVALLSFLPNRTMAQALGSITGIVYDASGAVVPGAHITVVNQGTNAEHATEANQTGYFAFTLLPIGNYQVRVTREGFQTFVSKGISLEGQQTISLEIKLTMGSVSETVSVTESEEQLVQRSDATLGQTIHAEQVTNLPLNGRNFVQLAMLTPGTTKSEQAGDFLNQGTSSEVSFRGSVSLSVQGMSENTNDWRYDGIDNNELTAGGVGFLPQIDAIQEFNVLTFNYSAQYGSRGGSTVLVSSKSGTNKLHGALFEFLRNDYLDARNYFDPIKKGKYRQNEFGGSVGGPVIRDKTFFFMDYQGNRVRQGAPILSTIPTGNQIKNHIFSNPIFDPTAYTTAAGSRPSYWDPTLNAYHIPDGQVSSIGQAILNLFPTNAPDPGTNGFKKGTNYIASPTRTLNDDEFDVRVDHQLGSNDRIFARFSWDNAFQFNPSGLPGFGSKSSYTSTTSFTTHARNMAISETHIFSPRIVNQIAAGYNRDFNYIRGIGYGTSAAQQIGITGANLGDAATSGMTLIAITGFNPIGDRLYSPYQGGTSIFHFFDSLSVVKGNHNMSFGIDFRPHQLNGLGETYFHGQMGFTKNFTAQVGSSQTFSANITDPASGVTGANGNPVASLLLGLPDSGNRTNQINSGIIGRRWKEIRGYAQDNWIISPKLTLNVGFAYGVTTPLSEALNRLSDFDVNTGNFYFAGSGTTASAKVIQADKYAGISTDYSNIEPRFGFSYSPFGAQHGTVLRGGYGVFHDTGHLGLSTEIHQNPPYTNTYSFQTNAITPIRVLMPNAATNGFPDNSQPKNPAAYSGSLVAQDLKFRQGLVQQYNFNVQQGLKDGTVVTVAYAGTHATRMFNLVSNYNAAPPGPGNNLAANRPFPQYVNISYITSNGWLLYNSLQAKVERRVHNLYFLGAYTYAQGISSGYAEGVTAGTGAVYFPLTLRSNIPMSGSSLPLTARADRGNSSLTLRNDFIASVVYALPFGKGKEFMKNAGRLADAAVGGWQLNTIVTSHSGFPLSFTQSTNSSGAGVGNRPDINYGCDFYAGAKTVTKWFNTSCVTTPALQTMGNASRTYGFGPGRTNVDLSFYKKFEILENQHLEFRGEFFNLLNHSQFATPDTGYGNGTFGVITGTTYSNRQVQFALKYIF